MVARKSVVLDLFGSDIMRIAPFVVTQTSGSWRPICKERGFFEVEVPGFPIESPYDMLAPRTCLLLARASSISLCDYMGAAKFSIQHSDEKYKVSYHDENSATICSIQFESISDIIKITTYGIDPSNLPLGSIIRSLEVVARTTIKTSLLDAVQKAVANQSERPAQLLDSAKADAMEEEMKILSAGLLIQAAS